MRASRLLFLKKIYSNAKISSSYEIMRSLSLLPSLVSRDLFLMLIQVSADSFCCWAFAGCGAAPGPRIALQRTFDNKVLHALLIEEPGSRRNLEAVLPAHCRHGLWQRLGFRVCTGRARAAALPAQVQTSLSITGGTARPHRSTAQWHVADLRPPPVAQGST